MAVQDYLVRYGIPGLYVQLVNNQTGAIFTTPAPSDSNGLWSIPSAVVDGTYTVYVSPTGLPGSWVATGDTNYVVNAGGSLLPPTSSYGRNWYSVGGTLSLNTPDGFGGHHYYWSGDQDEVSGGMLCDVTTGVFTVPTSGLYWLHAAMAAPNGHDWVTGQQVPFVSTPNGLHFAGGTHREDWQTGNDFSVLSVMCRLAANAQVRFGINVGNVTPAAPYFVAGEEYGVMVMKMAA